MYIERPFSVHACQAWREQGAELRSLPENVGE